MTEPCEQSCPRYRAARALHDEDAPPEEIARHLLAAESAGEPWVVSVLRAAAHAATARAQFGVAADYLRRILHEPLSPGERAVVLAELGQIEAGSHPAAAVRHLTEVLSLLGHENPARRLEVVTVLADALTRCRRGCQATELLDREAHAFVTTGSPRHDLAARLRLQRLLIDADDRAKRPHLAREVAEFEGRYPDDEVVQRGTAALRARCGAEQEPDAAAMATEARRALKGDFSPGVGIKVAGLAVQALTWCDQDEEAAVFIDRLAAHAQRDGEPQARIWASLNRTEHAWRTGDLHTAIETGRTCLELLSSSRGDNRLALVTAPLVRALVECDQADQAVPLLAVPDGNRLDDVWHGSHLLEARARLSVARGHLEDALADLLECGRRQTEWRRDNPAVLAWRSQAALVHLAMGDHASAQHLAEEELHQARAFGAPRAVGISLRAAGLTVRGGRGQRLVEESVGLLDEAGATLEQARSLIDLATLRFESGHTRLARELARRSLQLAQYCGAVALSNRALDRLRTFGGRPRSLRTVGIQALTESERRVVVLAAQGLTNREIAQERFITQRTVENHLTSSFRKLNITGRRQLPEAVRSLDVRL